MKKVILMALAFLIAPVVSFATMGVQTTTDQGVVTNTDGNRLVSFSGAVSGTGAADTSSAIVAKGYAGIQFKIVKATYRGTYKIQASRDSSTWNDIFESSLDGAAVTETVYWQSFQGFDFYRIVGDPNASNAGTATTTATLIAYTDQATPRYTGYFGIHTQPQEVFASAARTADADTYVYTEGNGIDVNMNATAASSGSVVLEVYTVSPTGVDTKCQFATAITAAGYRHIVVAPSVAPVSTPAAVDAAFINTGTGQRWHIVLNEAASNSLTSSVFVQPYKYNPPYMPSQK